MKNHRQRLASGFGLAALALGVFVVTALPAVATPNPAQIPDATLGTYIQHRLAERHLDGVEARVDAGDVTLTGEVANLRQKLAAERLAGDVEGVTEVHNWITLRPADATEIHAALQKVMDQYPFYDVFDWVEAVPNGSEVTLTGWVYQPWHRESIGQRVEAIPGVTEVRNGIEVLPVSSFDDQLRAQAARLIYGDLAFSQYFDTPNPPIHILVRNGKVTLQGVVHNDAERRLAETLVRNGTMSFGVVDGLRTQRELAK